MAGSCNSTGYFSVRRIPINMDILRQGPTKLAVSVGSVATFIVSCLLSLLFLPPSLRQLEILYIFSYKTGFSLSRMTR